MLSSTVHPALSAAIVAAVTSQLTKNAHFSSLKKRTGTDGKRRLYIS
jgi:hypothetical protein